MKYFLYCKEQALITPKQMLPRLPIANVQAKVGNTSINLLSKIKQVYLLFWIEEITRKVYNNILK